MRQLKREFKKMKKIKFILLFCIFIVIPNIVSASISDRVPLESWRSSAESTKVTYSDFMNDGSEEENKTFKEQLEIIDYCLDNDIPYKVKNPWIHMLDTSFLSVVIIVIIIFATNDVYSREYKLYTWDELFEDGKDKKQVFLGKVLFSIIQSFLYLIIMLCLSWIVGVIAYGAADNFKIVKLIDGDIVVVNVLSSVIKNYTLLLFKSVFYVLFTIMISVIFKEKKVGLCFPILLAILGAVNLLPFKCLNIGISTSYGELIKGIIIFLIFSIVFYFIALSKFKREEELYI